MTIMLGQISFLAAVNKPGPNHDGDPCTTSHRHLEVNLQTVLETCNFPGIYTPRRGLIVSSAEKSNIVSRKYTNRQKTRGGDIDHTTTLPVTRFCGDGRYLPIGEMSLSTLAGRPMTQPARAGGTNGIGHQ